MKLLPALPLLLFLCAFTDPSGRFSVHFPDGWSEPVESGNAIQSQSPGEAHLGWCRVNSNSLESLKDSRQADLNAQFADPISAEVWASMLGLDLAKISVADADARVVDGVIVQQATLTLAPGVAGDAEAKMRISSWILEGRVLNAACFAESPDFPKYESEFRRVVESLRPH